MFKQVLSLTLGLSFIAVSGFAVAEPGSVGAQASDDDTALVTLSVNEEISIAGAIDDSMTLGVAADNEDTAQHTWTVITNSADGYSLTLDSLGDPAMQNDGAGADISDLPTTTPAAWDTTIGTAADGVYFGFSAYGDDVDASFGSGTACGSGTIPADLNYRGFDATDGGTVVTTTGAPTATTGTNTTVCYAAEQNNQFAEDGSYTATITATATAA